jgi:subfamily B ATP-binding cassette protein MsbA
MFRLRSRVIFDWIERRLPQDPYGTAQLIVRLLAEYGPRYWRRYALSFACVAIVAGCTALFAYLISHAVNETYLHRNFVAVVVFCVLIFVLVSVKGLALYGQAFVLARIGNEITAENQQRMFDKLLRKNLGYFADRHSAEFVAQITSTAGAGPGVLSLLVTAIGRDTLTVIGLITVMVVQDPLVSLVALTAIPVTLLLVRSVIRRIRALTVRQYAAYVSIVESVQEMVRGLRTVKAFTLEQAIRRRVCDQVQDNRRAADEMAALSNRSTPLMEALGGGAVALLTLYAGYRVIYMNAMFGEFVSFITAFLLAYEPTKRLARFNITLSSSLLGVRMFYQLVDSPDTEPQDEDKPALTVKVGRIEFVNVDFAYRDDEPVLRGMSFVAEAGRVTALVGPSGGGKSTAFALVLGLYDVAAGKVAVDGQTIAMTSRASLRRQIAYVGQDVFLFRGTIRENIAFGKLGASEGEIIDAAKAAHAHEFIMSFPSGYDTPVGEHGLQLSTGQRQRVSIARAVLKDTPIILLDEATAALDSESERHVQDAMARLSEHRTTIVIAHRLQTIMHADRILFVEHGAVVESGSHHELLRGGGRYAAFHRLQFEEAPARPRMVSAV